MSHGYFFRQEEGGPMTIEGVIAVMLVVDVVSTTGQVSTDGGSLDFRGIANKKPMKRG